LQGHDGDTVAVFLAPHLFGDPILPAHLEADISKRPGLVLGWLEV
jgi:hypothetical protein